VVTAGQRVTKEKTAVLSVHLIKESRKQTWLLLVLEAALLIGRYNYSLGKVSLSSGAASFDVSLKV
jgi:hypothetical protein